MNQSMDPILPILRGLSPLHGVDPGDIVGAFFLNVVGDAVLARAELGGKVVNFFFIVHHVLSVRVPSYRYPRSD